MKMTNVLYCFHTVEHNCLSPMFWCDFSGRCIQSDYVCNDEDDCGNYQDEKDCKHSYVLALFVILKSTLFCTVKEGFEYEKITS